MPVDVAVREQVETAVAQAVSAYGSLDVVVNNAWGGGSMGRVENKTDGQLSDGIAVAYYGPFWAMRAALPHMRKSGWGRVINMCSLNGVNAHMGTLEYNAAKEALRALTRTAAREWAPYGVTVNAICPAAKSAAFMRALGNNPDVAAFADSMNPMGRIGDPYLDIAPVAVFLAGEGSRYLTGNTLFVDGGSHINGWPGRRSSTARSRAGEIVAFQPERPAQPIRPGRQRHLDGAARRDHITLFDVRAVVAPPHRTPRQVLVVAEVGIEREEHRFVRRDVAVGMAVT